MKTVLILICMAMLVTSCGRKGKLEPPASWTEPMKAQFREKPAEPAEAPKSGSANSKDDADF